MPTKPGQFPQYSAGRNQTEKPIPEKFKNLDLPPEGLECLILADQLISGEKEGDPVWAMTEFLNEKGWKLTVKGQEVDPEKSLYIPNPAHFSRNPQEKGIEITIPTYEGKPFGKSLTEQVAAHTVNEFIHGIVYFQGKEILEETEQLSEQDYQTMRQQLKSIRQAELKLLGEEIPAQQRTDEQWNRKIDQLLSS